MVSARGAPQHHVVPPRTRPHPYLAQLGKRIRDLRRQNGWTQEDLEAKAKIERVYISRIEGGRQNPSVLTLRALARAFKVTIPDLLPQDQ